MEYIFYWYEMMPRWISLFACLLVLLRYVVDSRIHAYLNLLIDAVSRWKKRPYSLGMYHLLKTVSI